MTNVPFVHRELGDLPRDGGRDVHVPLRLDPAVGGHLGLEVLAPDGCELDRSRLGAAVERDERGDAAGSDDDPGDDPARLLGIAPPLGLDRALQPSLRAAPPLVFALPPAASAVLGLLHHLGELASRQGVGPTAER